MKTAATMTLAVRFGRSGGRVWRGIVNLEGRLNCWMRGVGLPRFFCRILFLCAAALTLFLLFFIAFWLTLLLVFSLVAAWLLLNNHLDDEKLPELRDGHSGIGWYNKDDLRVDMDNSDEI